MPANRADLQASYRDMDDEQLLRRHASRDLTELAQDVARAELELRGLIPIEPSKADDELQRLAAANPGDGDLVNLASMATPTEAYLLRACLESNGIHGAVADAHLAQANSFLTGAIGGVRVLVFESRLTDARKVLAAFNAGEFALDDDALEDGSDGSEDPHP